MLTLVVGVCVVVLTFVVDDGAMEVGALVVLYTDDELWMVAFGDIASPEVPLCIVVFDTVAVDSVVFAAVALVDDVLLVVFFALVFEILFDPFVKLNNK